ncbi:unnamed protein product [Owenia fusiformis]|uniref:VWFA domain-containing protein n=1 Tax=Owenia fusiformis TaxID=6347 RepID=A0A8S4N0L9_OWEFU|nr:unnamed protein product [Owenia fusiformis]
MASQILMFIFVLGTLSQGIHHTKASSKSKTQPYKPSQMGILHFNNPQLLSGANDFLDGDNYFFDHSEDAVDPSLVGGIVLSREATSIASRLRDLSKKELGVPAMQTIFDSMPYEDKPPAASDAIDTLAYSLQKKFNRSLAVLRTNKVTVEYLYRFHVKVPITARSSCCDLDAEVLKSEDKYRFNKVTHKLSCDLISPSAPKGAFNPGRNLTEVFQHNVQLIPSLVWQYFISSMGIHNEFPACKFTSTNLPCGSLQDIRHRDVYLSTVQPQRKNVVILMDHGNSLSHNQLVMSKAVAAHIIESLSENDRVGMIALSGRAHYPRYDNCLSKKLAPLSYEAKLYFNKFIQNLEKQDTSTNHSLGFKAAFNMIRHSRPNTNSTQTSDKYLIAYVSRGLLSPLTEAKAVMTTIAQQQARVDNSVIINTYIVIDEGKPIMYERSFLSAIAAQDFENYNIKRPVEPPAIMKGEMVEVNSTRDLSQSVGKFYEAFDVPTSNQSRFSLPYVDLAKERLVMSITWPCFSEGRLSPKKVIGIMGLDIDMADIVQDITYYNTDMSSYAFLLNTDGIAVMHPAITRPIQTIVQPMHTDIRHFETNRGFIAIREKIINTASGVEVMAIHVNGSDVHPNDSPLHPGVYQAKYSWKRIVGTPLIVVIKDLTSRERMKELADVSASNQSPTDVYHRLDLLPTDGTCLHMKQVATFDSGTLFVSAQGFKKPYDYLSDDETKYMVKGYMAYLKDNTNLITNPGIKDSVKNDAGVLAKINSEWVRQFFNSYENDYIVRRYVATPSGVMRVFPGTLLAKSMDPTKRPWFRRALEFPSKVVFTAPYLDIGGAGYIVTMSHTIYEGKPAALHKKTDRVVAVMGIDFTLGYFYKMLVQQIPQCQYDTMRCFLFEDRGYLIAHPGVMEPNGKGPVEQQHITHKEPLVANDILNHNQFVKKQLCNSYNDRTVQRMYTFNTTAYRVLTNLVHGEHCARYQTTPIPGSNLFVGVINQTCNMMTAFCPCSMVDRLCLNCHSLEQTQCECPCECPLGMDFCTAELLAYNSRNPNCPSYPEEEKLAVAPESVTENLKPCFSTRCSDKFTQMECFGVLDCEWCQMDTDGRTKLKKPFCGSQRVCFGGVLGTPTPYGDEIPVQAFAESQDVVSFKSTPVGPVAGGIMGCFLVLALGVYCYRHHVHRNNHQYVTTVTGADGRMAHLDNEPDELEAPEDLGSGHTNIVLAMFENPATISPYRMNTMYRRPHGGDSSDHGYSTMTPHEDSERASTTCAEPLLISRDRLKPLLHSGTPVKAIPPPPHSNNSRRSRSPTPPQTRLIASPSNYAVIPEDTQTIIPQQTVLPSTVQESAPHHIFANVQVHMVDSH